MGRGGEDELGRRGLAKVTHLLRACGWRRRTAFVSCERGDGQGTRQIELNEGEGRGAAEGSGVQVGARRAGERRGWGVGVLERRRG